MEVVKWIFSLPIVAALQFLLPIVCEFLLRIIFKIILFILTFGNVKYGWAPYFDFEVKVLDFKSFIFATCLGVFISGMLTGFIAYYLLPNVGRKIALVLTGIVSFGIYVAMCASFWVGDHWFMSSCYVVACLIGWAALVMFSIYGKEI